MRPPDMVDLAAQRQTEYNLVMEATCHEIIESVGNDFDLVFSSSSSSSSPLQDSIHL